MTALLAITTAGALALWLRAARQRSAALRRESRSFVRSWKRRAALVRVARYCRAVDLTLGSAISAGIELGRQVRELEARIRRHEAGRLPHGMELIEALRRKHDEHIARRDAAIDALTARIAELMPCPDRAARLSTLAPAVDAEPRRDCQEGE